MFVTPEKSIELSRPKFDAKAKAKTAGRRQGDARRDAGGANADPAVDALSQQAATISREASGIAGGEAQTGAKYGEGQGQTVEVGRPRRRQAEGADNRSNALTRPISGSRAASSGPDSRPVSANRSGW